MKQPHVIAYGVEGRVLEHLESLAQERRIWLRCVRHAPACRNLLLSARPALLVLRLGRDLEGELTVLAQAHQLYPHTMVLVVCDAENAALTGLAWDLGAHCVLQPPLSLDLLRAVVTKFVHEAVE